LYSYTKDINVPIVTSGKNTVLRFKGSAVLKKGKMVGRIDPKENLLVNLFHNHKATGEIESLGSAGMIVKNSSLHIKSSMKNDPLVSCGWKWKIQVMERKEGVTAVAKIGQGGNAFAINANELGNIHFRNRVRC